MDVQPKCKSDINAYSLHTKWVEHPSKGKHDSPSPWCICSVTQFSLGEDRLCSFCAHSSKHVALESQSEARVLPSNRRAKLAFCPMCCPRIAERSSRFARRLPNPLSLHAVLPRTSGKLAVLYMGLLPCLVPLQFSKVVDGPLWYHRTANTK